MSQDQLVPILSTKLHTAPCQLGRSCLHSSVCHVHGWARRENKQETMRGCSMAPETPADLELQGVGFKDSFLRSCSERIFIILGWQRGIALTQISSALSNIHSDSNCSPWFVSFEYKPVYTINNASLPYQQNNPSLPLGTNHVSRQLIAEMRYLRKVALTVKCGNFSEGPKATII